MLQSFKSRSGWFTRAASKPGLLWDGAWSNWRYRREWGASAGKPLSHSILQGVQESDEHFRHLSFTASVIALSARIACADGKLTQEKYLAFREAFPLKGSLCSKIRSLFSLACHDHTPLERYITQIRYLYPEHRRLHYSLLERLFAIAAADSAITRNQERMLAMIAQLLHIQTEDYARLRSHYATPIQAHQVLGVNSRAKQVTLKKKYHALMRHYHPDRFSGEDISPELELLLQLKASEINAAYQRLRRTAGA